MNVTDLKVLTIPQVAERCQAEGIPLGVGAVRRLVKANRLPATHIGKKALIRWEDVLGFFEHADALDNIG